MHYQFSTMSEEIISEICTNREINVVRCTDAVTVYISLTNVDLSTVQVAKEFDEDGDGLPCFVAKGTAKVELPNEYTRFETSVDFFEDMETEIYLTVDEPKVDVKIEAGMLKITFGIEPKKETVSEVIFRA